MDEELNWLQKQNSATDTKYKSENTKFVIL